MAKKLFPEKKDSLSTLKPPRHSFLFSYAPYLKRSLAFLLGILLISTLLDFFNPTFWHAFKTFVHKKHHQITEPTKSFMTHTFSNVSIKAFFLSKHQTQKLQNDVLSLTEEVAALKNENTYLKALLEHTPPQSPTILTKVITFPSAPYKKSILLNAGDLNGLQKDDPILFGKTLVGRILQVFDTFSYGLLLSDGNSRIPIKIEEVNQEGLAKGIGDNRIKLDYIASHEGIKPGLRLYSSGRGGIYPPNHFIGTIETVNEDHIIAKLDISPKDLLFVQVLKTQKMLDTIETFKNDPSSKKSKNTD